MATRHHRIPRPPATPKTIPSPAAARPNVTVRGTSYIEVHGGASVQASESAVVSVYGDSTVTASGMATVIVWSGHVRVSLSEAAVLVDRSNPDPMLKAAEEVSQ